VDSPAYRLNHEEIIKALEEGITFAENMDPREIVADDQDQARSIVFKGPNGRTELPARTILVAAGTVPNITYEKEQPSTFALDSKQRFFQGYRAEASGGQVSLVEDPRGFFTSYNKDGRLISYYGDNHPAYAGNVVKAMASAKHGYRHVAALFPEDAQAYDATVAAARLAAWDDLTATLDREWLARVEWVERLTPTIVEVVVRAPAAARHFHPGQFYRLQNFETLAPRAADGSPLLMEGIALTGAWVDNEKGLLSLIALELGVSSRLCAYLTQGEPVVVMGPTGTPTEIPTGEDVMLAGGGLGNAVLFSIAKALRENGNRVIYFAGYRNGADLFKREEIEAATDQVIWSSDAGPEIPPGRPQDAHFRGNIVQ
jgi:NAD(P)H-flavin reductase